MPTLLTATLPVPPSVNHLHGTRGKRRFKLPEVVTYQEVCILLLSQARQDKGHIEQTRDDESMLAVSMNVYLPRGKRGKGPYERRDLDNMSKIVLDTVLNLYLAIDDSRVTDLRLSKHALLPDAAASLQIQVSAIVEGEVDDGRGNNYRDGNGKPTVAHKVA